MIRIKKSKKVQIEPPEFVCDYEITKHLSNYPQFAFLNVFNSSVLLGKPGQGKTSLLISILAQKPV